MPIKRGRVFSPVGIVVLATTMLVAALLFKHWDSKGTTPAPAIQSQAASSPNNLPETEHVTNSDAAGKVVQQILPDVSKSSLRTIRGTVRVKVRLYINEAGNVEKVQIESAGPSKYFASKSLEAAQQWKFAAPVSDGKNVPSQWNLEFQFKRTATRVHPVQVAPEPS
jgi:TonB family protein